jgi:hypothetical protein
MFALPGNSLLMVSALRPRRAKFCEFDRVRFADLGAVVALITVCHVLGSGCASIDSARQVKN